MKKKFFFLSMLATLVMTGCTQDDIVPGGGNEDNANGQQVETRYLSVKLMSSDASTRAADGYDDGTAPENNVKKVRFYFFTESGNAANVKKSGNNYVNYCDWTPGNGDQSTDNNNNDDIESKLSATIVINTEDGDKIPQRIVAVLNPDKLTGNAALGNASKSLSDLRKICHDFSSDVEKNTAETSNFVMFNSVYAENSQEIRSTSIGASNLCKSETDALKNPVVIYVERSVAKIKVGISSSAGFVDGKLALQNKADDNTTTPIVIDGKQVYLKITGWSLTADVNSGRLVKDIEPSWEPSWLQSASGFTYRSFWAINAPNVVNRYYDYNAIASTVGSDALYTNENAEFCVDDDGKTQDVNHTKVILKGTLCDKDENDFTIVRHLGAYFADTPNADNESENLKNLKQSILRQLRAADKHYYFATTKTDDEGKEQPAREEIGINDIKIITVDQKQEEKSKNNCYVYAELTEDAAKKTWYDSEEKTAEPLSEPDKTINADLQDKETVDWALVWNGGDTYYYYEILHKGAGLNPKSQAGVVRNHIYDTKVTAIYGLGTPVYDPNEIIYPETPDPNNHYIAASINILSWRIVTEDYELKW